MEVNKRRVSTTVVAAGSVWETRMKSDEVRGGIKVFKAERENVSSNSKLSKRSPIASSKRKTWNSNENNDSGSSNHNHNHNHKTISSSSSDGNGITLKKSPIQSRKVVVGASSSFERSPIVIRKVRSEDTTQLRKVKSDLIKNNNVVASVVSDDDSIQLRKTELDPVPDEPVENCEDLDLDLDLDADDDVCEEKEVLSSIPLENVVDNEVDEVEVEVEVEDDDDDIDVDEEKTQIEDIDVDEEKEKERFDVKEISIDPEQGAESKKQGAESKKVVVVMSEEESPKKVVVISEEESPKKVVSAQMRFHHRNQRSPVSSVPVVLKQSPTIRRNSTIYQNFSKPNSKSVPEAEEHYSFPQTQSKLQSLVDLIMWRDVSRSAFIFGIGTFTIISSSYAKDINLSLISAVSYVGLVYLAVIFLYRSLICRGVINVVDSNYYIMGEEDAIWMVKLILPYLNEFVSKLKALFSGDPGTTMKLAVLLFVLARCGSFITIWKMAKFGFFGVFTVPKICSSYSAQLTAYGNFWIRRFRDAWDTCTHKKAVALGIFALVWNLSSVVARIWAVFVLFVAFRYYQQHYMGRDEWVEDEPTGDDETWQEPVGVGATQKQAVRAAKSAGITTTNNKVKKGF